MTAVFGNKMSSRGEQRNNWSESVQLWVELQPDSGKLLVSFAQFDIFIYNMHILMILCVNSIFDTFRVLYHCIQYSIRLKNYGT